MPADGYDTTSVMAVISGPAEGRHMAPFIAWLNANPIQGEPAYRLVGTPLERRCWPTSRSPGVRRRRRWRRVQVLTDGHAQAMVASAWPRGTPLDEAGLYECELDADQLERVRSFARRTRSCARRPGEHGRPRRLGPRFVKLGNDGTKIAWGAFVTPAPAVADAVSAMRDMLAAVRRHPVAAVRMALVRNAGLELEQSRNEAGGCVAAPPTRGDLRQRRATSR